MDFKIVDEAGDSVVDLSCGGVGGQVVRFFRVMRGWPGEEGFVAVEERISGQVRKGRGVRAGWVSVVECWREGHG